MHEYAFYSNVMRCNGIHCIVIKAEIINPPEHEYNLEFWCRAHTPYSKMAAILVFFCLLANYPLLPRSRENILLYFEFKNEATRANLKANKRPLK